MSPKQNPSFPSVMLKTEVIGRLGIAQSDFLKPRLSVNLWRVLQRALLARTQVFLRLAFEPSRLPLGPRISISWLL